MWTPKKQARIIDSFAYSQQIAQAKIKASKALFEQSVGFELPFGPHLDQYSWSKLTTLLSIIHFNLGSSTRCKIKTAHSAFANSSTSLRLQRPIIRQSGSQAVRFLCASIQKFSKLFYAFLKSYSTFFSFCLMFRPTDDCCGLYLEPLNLGPYESMKARITVCAEQNPNNTASKRICKSKSD
jgi:hypothetical protein